MVVATVDNQTITIFPVAQIVEYVGEAGDEDCLDLFNFTTRINDVETLFSFECDNQGTH